MEKLCYVLFESAGLAPAALARELRGPIAFELRAKGAHGLVLHLSDEDVAGKVGARITRLEPTVAAVVSFWVERPEQRADLEPALARVAPRFAAYSVLESVALAPDAARGAPAGERTPGIVMVALIAPKPGQAREAWLAHWLEVHRVVALETQATFSYVRNVVVRALAPDAPPWLGIVEEGFPAEAVGDPMLWYRASGSQERLSANLGRMIASCQAFLELDRVESHPFSEYRFD